MTTWIYSHNMNSEGANLLKDAMRIRKIRHERSTFRGGPNKRVINWGHGGDLPAEINRCQVLNLPQHVRSASNKLDFFRKVRDSVLPPWTTEHATALEWVGEGNVVCARTILNGHSAAGLVLMMRNNPQGFVQAPLYTKYIKKAEEYRIHVVNGAVIDSQRKVLTRERAEQGDVNWYIRNLDNGFIYQRNNINPPQPVFDVALQAMADSELYFGAVDIIWNQASRRAYVLEINTAPGITGTTVQNYAEALRE